MVSERRHTLRSVLPDDLSPGKASSSSASVSLAASTFWSSFACSSFVANARSSCPRTTVSCNTKNNGFNISISFVRHHLGIPLDQKKQHLNNCTRNRRKVGIKKESSRVGFLFLERRRRNKSFCGSTWLFKHGTQYEHRDARNNAINGGRIKSHAVHEAQVGNGGYLSMTSLTG